jgi:ribonuclease R
MSKQNISTGTITLTTRGFGFVQTPDTSILIPFDHLGRALSGDTVEAELLPDTRPDKPAGRVVRVKERSRAPIIGRVRKAKDRWQLVAEGNRSPVPLILKDGERSTEQAELRQGDVVRARFDSWNEGSDPIALLEAVIARSNDADAELKLIALSRNLDLTFPEKVTRVAQKISPPDPARISRGRRDIRDWRCLTIDPVSAKDFDDAVSIEQLDNGMLRVGVHIADVSAYVEPDDPIDTEAWKRGTSVYLVDRVLPMLPEHLSNGVCSLVPNEPRFAMSVVAKLDSLGGIHEVEMFESLIESKRRFTYQEVEDVLQGGNDPFARELHLMQLVAQTLKHKREIGGSVDFDFSSREIQVDENGVPVSVRPAERGASNRLVEEFMLLANRLVAERLAGESRVPGIYRVHDRPRQSDLNQLIDTLRDLGIPYKLNDKEELGPDDYRAVLSIVENFEFKELVETIAVKALPKAVYSTENRGHFGLAMEAYTHFTSPIRRYPDLVVHRLIKRLLGRRRPPRASAGLRSFLEKTCVHASERERLATDAEREYGQLKALEFLSRKIGRSYNGVVTGVASVGIFVEIEKYLVDGLVHVSELGKEWFELDRANHRLIGKEGTVFRLGDRVRVTVKGVNPERRTADFVLANDE